jgi:hypothetical protein
MQFLDIPISRGCAGTTRDSSNKPLKSCKSSSATSGRFSELRFSFLCYGGSSFQQLAMERRTMGSAFLLQTGDVESNLHLEKFPSSADFVQTHFFFWLLSITHCVLFAKSQVRSAI